ncbi:MAG: iron-sulfur cluster assembly protein [Hyphomicrobiaceae bacterium]|jgi:iron-sulfur cluster assembly protein
MMSLTEQAADRIVKFVTDDSEGANEGLRVRVIGGGCSGLQYKVGLDACKKGDKVFERDGARLFVDRRSYLYLNGTEIDWSNDLTGAGFRFVNPNVKKTCGCGESFVV